MAGPAITGRSVWPTAVVTVVLLLAGLGVAERSEGLVGDVLAGLAGAEGDGPADDAEEAGPGDSPGGTRDAGADGDQPAEPRNEPLEESPSACRAPVLPPPPAEAVVLAEGCTVLEVGPGEERIVDGHAVARQRGAQPPACAAFGSRFSWRVTDEPPARVELTAVRQGARHQLAAGAAGEARGLCGTVSVTNPAATTTTLDLRYLLLDCQPAGRAC